MPARAPPVVAAAPQAMLSEYKAVTEVEKAEVVSLGGLHVIGTERHESRRIDNQLRGRSGRQGDPGSTRFFLSLEDPLFRVFGGDRIKNLMVAFQVGGCACGFVGGRTGGMAGTEGGERYGRRGVGGWKGEKSINRGRHRCTGPFFFPCPSQSSSRAPAYLTLPPGMLRIVGPHLTAVHLLCSFTVGAAASHISHPSPTRARFPPSG
jgi:hypothetical protein